MKEDMIFKFQSGICITVDARKIPMIPCRNEYVYWDEVEYYVAQIEHHYKDNQFVHTIINLVKS